MGGSTSTGAKGLKRVSDFTRSKSAPPGFGVLEEENEELEPTISHEIYGFSKNGLYGKIKGRVEVSGTLLDNSIKQSFSVA